MDEGECSEVLDKGSGVVRILATLMRLYCNSRGYD